MVSDWKPDCGLDLDMSHDSLESTFFSSLQVLQLRCYIKLNSGVTWTLKSIWILLHHFLLHSSTLQSCGVRQNYYTLLISVPALLLHQLIIDVFFFIIYLSSSQKVGLCIWLLLAFVEARTMH